MADFDALTGLMSDALETAMANTSAQLTISLRVMASAAGWPTRLVNLLQVIEEDGHFLPAYPKEAAAAIEDLEYGITGEPSPVLRRFINRSDAMADFALNRAFA